MSHRLIVRPEAEAEIAAAFRWYEEQHPGLGREFIEVISSCLDQVAANPGRFPRVHGIVRRALSKKFPYAIFFIEDETTVVVLAAVHMVRNPEVWKRRTGS